MQDAKKKYSVNDAIFDRAMKEAFKTRDKKTGEFKPTEYDGYVYTVTVIPQEELLQFAKSNCNVTCNGKGYLVKHIDPKKYNLSFCTVITDDKWEVLDPDLYKEVARLAGTPKYQMDEKGEVVRVGKKKEPVVIGKYPALVRTIVTCSCVEKKAMAKKGWLHNQQRTEWYNIGFVPVEKKED